MRVSAGAETEAAGVEVMVDVSLAILIGVQVLVATDVMLGPVVAEYVGEPVGTRVIVLVLVLVLVLVGVGVHAANTLILAWATTLPLASRRYVQTPGVANMWLKDWPWDSRPLFQPTLSLETAPVSPSRFVHVTVVPE